MPRFGYFRDWVQKITKNEGSLDNFSRAYEYYGFTYSKQQKGITYREWAPNAQEAYLIGDFSIVVCL